MVVDHELAAPISSATLGAPRVLVVDDEETVMVTIQGILELDGYAVTATTSGEDALELIRTHSFDVVLTDLRMDGMDGIDLLKVVRSQSPDTVTLMLTGYASLDSALTALREGAYDYLVKPCDVVDLRATVSRAVERSRLAAQLRDRLHDLERANETIRALNLELETRVEQATAELRQEITARDEVTAALSHDLRSPLTFIKGMANLRRRVATVTPETQPLVRALEQIDASAGRMALQLDELVDSSRLQAGRALELRRSPTDLIALARIAVGQHQGTTDRHAIRLKTDLDTLVGDWDEIRLSRVLDNLLDNALKFSPRGGAIHVAIGVQGDSAIVAISDFGEGIPEGDLAHVFERFRRGRNVEGRIPGTGIGLAGAQGIVELHGGSITVESQIEHGATFTLRLPIHFAEVHSRPQN
ncbi:MAG: hybrid sensor histidine kinase/response regulator [Chloroflexi bacterium]|nr:hybrid sensor histidine kinase/response regulator [Chloroflexota bacterium]